MKTLGIFLFVTLLAVISAQDPVDIVGGDGTEVVEGSDGGQPRRGNFFATFMQRLRQKKQRIMERKRGIFAEKFDKIRQKFQRSEEPVEQEEPAEDEVNDEH